MAIFEEHSLLPSHVQGIWNSQFTLQRDLCSTPSYVQEALELQPCPFDFRLRPLYHSHDEHSRTQTEQLSLHSESKVWEKEWVEKHYSSFMNSEIEILWQWMHCIENMLAKDSVQWATHLLKLLLELLFTVSKACRFDLSVSGCTVPKVLLSHF